MTISKFETILVDRKDRVGIITLNRPDHLNAMNRTMHKELRDQMETFNDDSTIGAIVITGSGRAYSAGADIGDFENVEVIELLVKDGQKIAKNDAVVTIESDKSSVEIPSSLSGIIETI